ncbi:MAG: HlyD family secretion protein [Desulfurobacteriaceae bacterium]
MKKIFSTVAFLLIGLVTLWLFYYFYLRHVYVITDNAFQDTQMVSVSTQSVSGKLVKLFKDEYQKVKKGEPLFKIDDAIYRKEVGVLEEKLKALKSKKEELQNKLKRLKIQLSLKVKANAEELKAIKEKLYQLDYQEELEKKNYQTTLSKAKSRLKSLQKSLEEAEANLTYWKKQFERYKRLYEKRVISLEQLEKVGLSYKHAVSLFEAANSQLEAAKEDIKAAESLKNRVEIVKSQKEELRRKIEALKKQLLISKADLKRIEELKISIKQLEKEIASLKHQLEKAKVLLSYTLVKSPIDGVIAKKWKEEGDFISPGLPVYSIYDPKTFYVLAWIEEDKLRDFKVGSYVKAKLEACGKEFEGKVSSIGSSAGSVFSLIPKDTSSGEYTKVVQRVPVKIKLESVPLNCIKPGTNVLVYIKKE